MKNVVEVKNITKNYDNKFTLDLSFDIQSGFITGLIGENGAGKTTLIKSLLNIIKLNNGTIKIFGLDNIKNEEEIKENIGVVLDNSFFPELLNANNINSIMKDLYKSWDRNLYYKYLKDFSIPLDKTIKTFSKGMKKKLEIATALAHHPKLLILDEPTSGLDPVVRNEVLEIFQSFIKDEEHSIIFSTHITSDLENIADNIIFIDNGKLILNKPCNEIMDNYGILKCDIKDFSKIDNNDIVKYKQNKYNYEILINDRRKLSKKYKDFIIDKITLEELMVLIIKGVK